MAVLGDLSETKFTLIKKPRIVKTRHFQGCEIIRKALHIPHLLHNVIRLFVLKTYHYALL